MPPRARKPKPAPTAPPAGAATAVADQEPEVLGADEAVAAAAPVTPQAAAKPTRDAAAGPTKTRKDGTYADLDGVVERLMRTDARELTIRQIIRECWHQEGEVSEDQVHAAMRLLAKDKRFSLSVREQVYHAKLALVTTKAPAPPRSDAFQLGVKEHAVGGEIFDNPYSKAGTPGSVELAAEWEDGWLSAENAQLAPGEAAVKPEEIPPGPVAPPPSAKPAPAAAAPAPAPTAAEGFDDMPEDDEGEDEPEKEEDDAEPEDDEAGDPAEAVDPRAETRPITRQEAAAALPGAKTVGDMLAAAAGPAPELTAPAHLGADHAEAFIALQRHAAAGRALASRYRALCAEAADIAEAAKAKRKQIGEHIERMATHGGLDLQLDWRDQLARIEAPEVDAMLAAGEEDGGDEDLFLGAPGTPAAVEPKAPAPKPAAAPQPPATAAKGKGSLRDQARSQQALREALNGQDLGLDPTGFPAAELVLSKDAGVVAMPVFQNGELYALIREGLPDGYAELRRLWTPAAWARDAELEYGEAKASVELVEKDLKMERGGRRCGLVIKAKSRTWVVGPMVDSFYVRLP